MRGQAGSDQLFETRGLLNKSQTPITTRQLTYIYARAYLVSKSELGRSGR